MTEQIKEELFDVNTPATLLVENIRGAVQVQAEDRDTIQVTATKYTDTGDDEKTILVFEKVNDSTIRIATRVQKSTSSVFKNNAIRPCRVRYEILVPEDCSLVLDCVSSSAEIQGLRGDHRLELVSGDLNAHFLSGDMKLNSVSGDIQTSGLIGNIDFTTVSGNIALAALASENLHINTVSGDIKIETETISEGFAIETISGDVELDLQPEAAFTVQMTSLSGDVRSDLPILRNLNQMGHRVYEIQGGGPTLRLKSLSGDLHIHNKYAAPHTPIVDRLPVVDSMAILEQVANGELSVDGAIDALHE